MFLVTIKNKLMKILLQPSPLLPPALVAPLPSIPPPALVLPAAAAAPRHNALITQSSCQKLASCVLRCSEFGGQNGQIAVVFCQRQHRDLRGRARLRVTARTP